MRALGAGDLDRSRLPGRRVGHQAVPGGPLDINVNGTYWVVAEQNDCVLDITELKAA